MKISSLISIDDLSDSDIASILNESRSYKSGIKEMQKKAVIMTAFFEPSTRTRLSFELAAYRLGLSVAHFDGPNSSLKKGESVLQSLHTLRCLLPDLLIVRMSEKFSQEFINGHGTRLINAGDGCNEHPTQALLDAFVLLEHFGSDDLFKKKILIVGDIQHSRVAHSNIKLLQRLGAHISLLSHQALEEEKKSINGDLFRDYSDIKESYDAIMMLRIQKERLNSNFALSENNYSERYCLTAHRLSSLGKNCVILHPGPVNIGTELSAELRFSPKSLIDKQVSHGLLLRAALIKMLLGDDYEKNRIFGFS